MHLYHGTSTKRLSSILSGGIIPRTDLGNWEHFPSHPQFVYLTRAYAFYFAAQAASDDDLPCVLEINTDWLDTKGLYPDEDAVAQWMQRQEGHSAPLSDIQNEVLRDIESLKKDFTWSWSLKYLGNCAYKGIIDPRAIKKICVVDFKERRDLYMMVLDPTISSINYAIMGEKYRNITDWFFEYLGNFISSYDEQIGELIGGNYISSLMEICFNRSGIQLIHVPARPIDALGFIQTGNNDS